MVGSKEYRKFCCQLCSENGKTLRARYGTESSPSLSLINIEEGRIEERRIFMDTVPYQVRDPSVGNLFKPMAGS